MRAYGVGIGFLHSRHKGLIVDSSYMLAVATLSEHFSFELIIRKSISPFIFQSLNFPNTPSNAELVRENAMQLDPTR